AAKAKVTQQEASVRNAKLTLDRMQALIKDQFVSQQDLDTAEVNLDGAVAALESLRAQVKQMEVALAQAETNLAYSYIRAPFAGYVAERNLDLGAYVTGAATANSTTSRGIVSLHDVETVRTLIEVLVGKHHNAVQIPIDAVSRLEDAQYVYIVRDGKAERIAVEIGVRDENR